MKKAVVQTLSLVLVLFLFGAARGLVDSRYLGVREANEALTAYVQQQGMDTEIETVYDWTHRDYAAKNELDFALRYDRRGAFILDSRISELVQQQAEADFARVRSAFEEELTLPQGIEVKTGLDSADNSHIKQLLRITGARYEGSLSPEESLRAPAKLAMAVIGALGGDYNITDVEITYSDPNGSYAVNVRSDGYEEITGDAIAKRTQKLKD